MVEQQTFNLPVPGSIPGASTPFPPLIFPRSTHASKSPSSNGQDGTLSRCKSRFDSGRGCSILSALLSNGKTEPFEGSQPGSTPGRAILPY